MTKLPLLKPFHSSMVSHSAVTIALCAMPGLILGHVVQAYATVWVGAVAAVVGVLTGSFVVRVGVRGRRPSVNAIVKVLTIIVIAVLLSFSVALLKPGFRNLGLFRSWFDALTHGWADLATSPVPAFAEPRTLVPVALMSCLAAAVSAFCLRKRIGPLMVLLAPTCAFLLAVVAAGQHPFLAVPAAMLFVALAGWILFSHSRHLSSAERQRKGATGNLSSRSRGQNRLVNRISMGGLSVLTLAGAFVVGPALTFGRDQRPFDPRDHVRPPVLPTSAVSPLELVAASRQSGDQELFVVRASRTLYPQDLRLVALNHFDGATWSTTARFTRGGALLDSAKRETIAMSPVDARVTILKLDGPWLPSIGDPFSVAGIPVIVDPQSGSLVASGFVENGASYDMKSLRPEPKVEQLVLLPVGSSSEGLDALVIPAGMPPLFSKMAHTAIGDAQVPFQRAVELRNYLRSSFKLNNSRPGGFSYGHLERAFVQEGNATDEQFATMFATLGRVVGLPTRVVVGFMPPPPNSNGEITVHGSDARVWAEVLFENVGWMPFTATPSESGPVSSSIGFGGQDEVELRQAPVVAPNRNPPPLLQDNSPAQQGQPNVTHRDPTSLIVGALLVIAVSGLGLALIALIKRRKTAQRRANPPREAVIGAWRDVLDRLVETGVVSTSTMTIEEVVQATESSSAALAGLYRPVNRALYSDSEITDSDREQAWRARDRFVSSLNRRFSFRQRVMQAVDPRPLMTARPRAVRHTIDHTIGAQP
jgi:uncharacterized membrane protein YoaK (UPF0700 family)